MLIERSHGLRVPLSELPHLLYALPESDLDWCPQQLSEAARTSTRENVAGVRYLVVDLDFALAEDSFDEDDVLRTAAARYLPSPCAIVSTGGGFHVYWDVASGSSSGAPEAPARGDRQGGQVNPQTCLRERSAARERSILLYETATERLCSLLAPLGADRAAANVAHLFRLPGSFSTKHEQRVEVVWNAPTRTSVSEVLGALPGRVKVRATPRRGSYSVPAECRAVDTPAIRWLSRHVIPDGCRNAAVFAMVQAHLFSGYTQTETAQRVERWARQSTSPAVDSASILQVAASCGRRHAKGNPQGLDARKLAEIRDQNGETMSPRVAGSIYRGLPRRSPLQGSRGSNGSTRRKPFEIALEAVRSGALRGPLADEAAARITGIPLSTYKQRVKSELKALGFCKVVRDGAQQRSQYVSPETTPQTPTTYVGPCTREEARLDEDKQLGERGFVERKTSGRHHRQGMGMVVGEGLQPHECPY